MNYSNSIHLARNNNAALFLCTKIPVHDKIGSCDKRNYVCTVEAG